MVLAAYFSNPEGNLVELYGATGKSGFRLPYARLVDLTVSETELLRIAEVTEPGEAAQRTQWLLRRFAHLTQAALPANSGVTKHEEKIDDREDAGAGDAGAGVTNGLEEGGGGLPLVLHQQLREFDAKMERILELLWFFHRPLP